MLVVLDDTTSYGGLAALHGVDVSLADGSVESVVTGLATPIEITVCPDADVTTPVLFQFFDVGTQTALKTGLTTTVLNNCFVGETTHNTQFFLASDPAGLTIVASSPTNPTTPTTTPTTTTTSDSDDDLKWNGLAFAVGEGLLAFLLVVGSVMQCAARKTVYPHTRSGRRSVCAFACLYNFPGFYCCYRDRALPMCLRVLWLGFLVHLQACAVAYLLHEELELLKDDALLNAVVVGAILSPVMLLHNCGSRLLATLKDKH